MTEDVMVVVLATLVVLIGVAGWSVGHLRRLEAEVARYVPKRENVAAGPHSSSDVAYLMLQRMARGKNYSRNYMRARYGMSAYAWNNASLLLKKLGIRRNNDLLVTYDKGVALLNAWHEEIDRLHKMGTFVQPD